VLDSDEEDSEESSDEAEESSSDSEGGGGGPRAPKPPKPAKPAGKAGTPAAAASAAAAAQAAGSMVPAKVPTLEEAVLNELAKEAGACPHTADSWRDAATRVMTKVWPFTPLTVSGVAPPKQSRAKSCLLGELMPQLGA
jgi:hypothetical protein